MTMKIGANDIFKVKIQKSSFLTLKQAETRNRVGFTRYIRSSDTGQNKPSQNLEKKKPKTH